MLERVDARRMPVAPAKPYRVPANRLDCQRVDVLRKERFVESFAAGQFVDTPGTTAGSPQGPPWIEALVTVFPDNPHLSLRWRGNLRWFWTVPYRAGNSKGAHLG